MEVGDRQIGKAVIIKVTPGTTEGVPHVFDHAALCDLCEGPVPVVAIEPVLPAFAGNEEILISVVVKVGPTRAGRQDDLARGNAVGDLPVLEYLSRALNGRPFLPEGAKST